MMFSVPLCTTQLPGLLDGSRIHVCHRSTLQAVPDFRLPLVTGPHLDIAHRDPVAATLRTFVHLRNALTEERHVDFLDVECLNPPEIFKVRMGSKEILGSHVTAEIHHSTRERQPLLLHCALNECVQLAVWTFGHIVTN
jgi:hypothetical protein